MLVGEPGDFALEAGVDFLGVVEHRLVPARVRSEWSRLRLRGIGSVWSPASQDSSHVGHAGARVVLLKGALLSLPTIATAGFRTYFTLGRAIRCLLPLGSGRFMHLVVLYGYQGSSTSSDQLTDQLIDAALSELAVVARGQPCLIVGDFNVESTKIPCLAKGISAGLWVDLESCWAFASGREPAVTCKRTWASDSGNRRDFQIGCPLCAAAVRSCSVLSERWTQPHLAVRSWFGAKRWTAKVTQPVRFTSLWPASWLSVVDKSRDSKSAEIRRVWEMYDERLQLIGAGDVFRLNDALQDCDVSQAWLVWSHAAEAALVDAYRLAGGPEPERGVKLGRGVARFSVVRLGGPEMRSARARCADPADGAQVDLYRDNSIAHLIDLRRRLRSVLDVVGAIGRSGYSLARGLELTRQWERVLRVCPLGTVTGERLRTVSGLNLPGFGVEVVLMLIDVVRRKKVTAMVVLTVGRGRSLKPCRPPGLMA